MHALCTALRFSSAAAILAILLGVAGTAGAAQENKDKERDRPKPAASHPAPPSGPAANSAPSRPQNETPPPRPPANAPPAPNPAPPASGNSSNNGANPNSNPANPSRNGTWGSNPDRGGNANDQRGEGRSQRWNNPSNGSQTNPGNTQNTPAPNNQNNNSGNQNNQGNSGTFRTPGNPSNNNPNANYQSGPAPRNDIQGPRAYPGNTSTDSQRNAGNFARPVANGPSPIRTVLPRGAVEITTGTGAVVRNRPTGGWSDLHDPKRGIDVHRELNGNRAIVVDRPDHSRIFAMKGRPGYIQRQFNFHGSDFALRTYVYRGRTYSSFYRDFGYRGERLSIYAPRAYFRPAFYGWVYNPWYAPVSYPWGFGAAPWYRFFGFYFAPYPSYPSAAFWLTDYLIAMDLQAAYAARQDAGELYVNSFGYGGSPVLTPYIKGQIAEEVRNDLALENQEGQQIAQGGYPDPASSGIPRLLTDGRTHVFVVGSPLDVTDNSGAECSLSDGNVLQLNPGGDPNLPWASLLVLASKGGSECRQGFTVNVQLGDLQEMQNQMRQTIDQGLNDLEQKQNSGGLPPLPPSAQGDPYQPQYAASAPPPDPNAAAMIQQQMQQADQAELDASLAQPLQGGAPESAAQYAPAGPNSQGAPATVSLGQTTEQVQAVMGPPSRIANLGAKVIYYYNGMKVIFQNGVVTDVQ